MENKYLIDGREVEVIEELKSGYLVCEVYETNEEEYISSPDRPFIVTKEQLFDSAPVAKYDSNILELDKNLGELRAQKAELEKEIVQKKKDNEETIRKWEQYKGLKNLSNFIEGKISHYVIKQYNGVDILEWDKSTSEYSDSEKGVAKLRLLTLFGKSKGELEWNLNKYSDGSGGNTEVTPCTSYEEAIEVAKALYQVVWDRYMEKGDGYIHSYIVNADKHGIDAPPEVILKFQEASKVAAENAINTKKKELEDAEKRLQDMEAGNYNIGSGKQRKS